MDDARYRVVKDKSRNDEIAKMKSKMMEELK